MFFSVQASDESKKVQRVPDDYRHHQHDSQKNSASLENDSMLLPHDRVGSDFSWLQVQSQEDSTVQKVDERDDEESFFYGNEDTEGKQANKSAATLFAACSQIGEHSNLQEIDVSVLCSQQHHQTKSIFSSFGDLLDLKQPLQMTSSSLTSDNLDSSECEKIKNILRSLGAPDIHKIMVKMQGQNEEKLLPPSLLGSDPKAASLALPAMNNPNVRQALESLQSLIKGENPLLNERFYLIIQLVEYYYFIFTNCIYPFLSTLLIGFIIVDDFMSKVKLYYLNMCSYKS